MLIMVMSGQTRACCQAHQEHTAACLSSVLPHRAKMPSHRPVVRTPDPRSLDPVPCQPDRRQLQCMGQYLSCRPSSTKLILSSVPELPGSRPCSSGSCTHA